MDRRRRDTKERFTKFALDKIREQGEDDITLRDLAKEFGISAAALYNHFADKDELLNDVLKVASDKISSLYHDYVEDNGTVKTATDKLVQFGEFLLELTRKENNLIKFMFFSKTAINVYSSVDVFENSQFKLLTIACNLIDKVRSENKLKITNYDLYIKFWSFIEGYALFVSSGVFDSNPSFVREAVLDVIAGDQKR